MPSRIFGLDLMRAIAILLVVYWHSLDLIAELAPWFRAPLFLDGVDLFFVLSGYLIGGILLDADRRGGHSWLQRLLRFWIRRCFRTLPSYYLFLVVNILVLALGLGKGLLNHNALAYFAFLQNVWKPLDLFYWESWSLVVEVWFYFLFPIALYLCLGLLRLGSNWSYGGTILAFLLVPLICRYHFLPVTDSVFIGEVIVRKLVVTRIDTIVVGVLAAVLHDRFPGTWRRLSWPAFALGMLVIVVAPTFYGNSTLEYSVTWFYTLNAFGMALLLPVLSGWRDAPRWGAAVTFFSGISYSLYLVHLPLRYILEPWYQPVAPLAGWMQTVLYWSACAGIAWLVTRYYERPFMAWGAQLSARFFAQPVKSDQADHDRS